MRHLKNFTELTLYAGISCSIAFFVRLNPAFFYSVLLFRIGFLLYCLYVIAKLEEHRELTMILVGAMLIGWMGGYLDLILVYLEYDLENIIYTLTTIVVIVVVVAIAYNHVTQTNKK